jgi:general secretion pathway protein B
MSFILDALKKLEEKRQHGAVPDLLTVHNSHPVKSGRRFIWLYILLSALLLNAVILTIWLRPWSAGRQETAHEPAVIKQAKKDAVAQPPATTPVITAVEPVPAVQKPETDIKKSAKADAEPAAKSINETATNAAMNKGAEHSIQKEDPPAVKEVRDAVPVSSPETPALPPQEKQDEVTYNYQTASGERLPDLEQLPLSIRQEMPEIKLSGHIYSDNPSARLVNINGSIRREGDVVASGVKLVEISDSGVILSYKDARFYMRGF